MSKTPEEIKAWNKQAYGNEEFPNYIKDRIATRAGARMVVLSMLSDAQSIGEHLKECPGATDTLRGLERQRQLLNQAKHVVDRYLTTAPSDYERATLLVAADYFFHGQPLLL